MNDKLIGNLALQFSTEEYDLDADAWRIGKKMLEWLLRRYCLVEKSKVAEGYKRAIETNRNGKETGAYSLCTMGSARKVLLESLFPEIAKEVEGEEMLTVSRKEVMRNFAEKVAWKNHHQSSKHDRDMAAGWCNALHFLFGSKCLPDENKECSNPSVVNCKHKHGDGTCSLSGMCCYKSPKPAEPITQFKFKVGDKVVYHPFKSNSFYNAEVLEIRDKEDKSYLLKLEDAENIWAYSVEVQSVAETYPQEPKPAEPDEKDDCKKFTKRLDDTLEGEIKEPFKEWYDKKYSNVEKLEKNGEVEPKFKVGDKVRYKEFVGTVYQIEETDYVIRKLAGGDLIGWLKESDLEPYTEPTNEDFVTLGVESAEYLRKSLEESEYRNSSQNIENCDKQFDTIFKDSFVKERRLNIAAMAMQGIMANPNPQMVEMDAHRVADLAILMADTLIAECEKGGQK